LATRGLWHPDQKAKAPSLTATDIGRVAHNLGGQCLELAANGTTKQTTRGGVTTTLRRFGGGAACRVVRTGNIITTVTIHAPAPKGSKTGPTNFDFQYAPATSGTHGHPITGQFTQEVEPGAKEPHSVVVDGYASGSTAGHAGAMACRGSAVKNDCGISAENNPAAVTGVPAALLLNAAAGHAAATLAAFN
jgi:hypothetical protein